MSRRAIILSSLLVALGCGDDDVSLPCNVADRACQRAVFTATAKSRGQMNATLPRVRVITRAQLAAELRASVEGQSDELPPDEALEQEQGQRALALLGLLPPPAKQSVDDAYIEQSIATIAAYYSHSSHDITVIADQTKDREEATVTLSHEFVHALQDQREGLSRLQREHSETTDDDIALTSLIEGEATWLSYVTFYREIHGLEIDRWNHPKLFRSILDNTLAAVEESSAPLIDTIELMPYPVGGKRLSEIEVEQGAGAIRELYDDPPLTLRWWAAEPLDGLPADLDCDVPPAPDGYQRFDEDRLGFGGVLAFRTAQGEDALSAYAAAEHWRADRIASYASESEPTRVAIVWRILLDSDVAARSLAGFTNASGSATALAQDNVVVLSAATDPDLLERWSPSQGCPAFDKRRGGAAHSTLIAIKRKLGMLR
jgi:hypothetical protein